MVGEDHILLRPELPKERPPRNPRRLRDLVHRRRLVPLLGKQPQRMIDHSQPKLRGVGSTNGVELSLGTSKR